MFLLYGPIGNLNGKLLRVNEDELLLCEHKHCQKWKMGGDTMCDYELLNTAPLFVLFITRIL